MLGVTWRWMPKFYEYGGGRGGAGAGRVAGEGDAGVGVLVVALDARFVVKASVGGIGEARRGIGNDPALLARVELRQTKIVEIPLLKRHREEWLPANTIGQRQPGGDFPGVLRERHKEVLGQIQGIGIGLPELRHLPQEKVRHAQTRCSTVDGVGGVGPCLRDLPGDRTHIVSAEGKLVRSLNDAHIVIHTEVAEMRKGVRAKARVSRN